MLHFRARFVVVALLVLLSASMIRAADSISIAGTWRFALDRDNAGIDKQWFKQTLHDQVKLPGSLQEQNFGDAPSADTDWISGIGKKLLAEPKYEPYRKAADFKTPFWLTPSRHYVGAAWYQREVEIPADWKDKRIVLFLQRPHWETSVWIDDRAFGSKNSLGTPHEYDLTDALTPGVHRLTIRVDNTIKIPVGNDAHSVSDQTQTDWNGVIGELKLYATGKVWIDDVQTYPDVARKSATLKIAIGNLTHSAGDGTISVHSSTGDREEPIHWDTSGGHADVNVSLGADAKPWDEFSPSLQGVTLKLKSAGGTVIDEREVTFGLREIGVAGTRFTINGRPIFLRGTLECCIFPLTGYPPTDVESWKRILRIAREHGLNHLRFHSWCPPEAAFVAADEMGFYYQVECSCWARFGNGSPLDTWIYDEATAMLRTYGNHPSFIMMAASNEPARNVSDAFLAKWVSHFSQLDPRRRYTAGSGWPQLPENQYNVMTRPRMHQSKELNRPPQTQGDYADVVAQYHVPIVTHEMGQWCAYPNFDEIPKYTGSLRSGSLEIFKDFLAKAGMADQAHDFLMASGKFQAALYKEEIEAQLRTAGVAGFELLDLHDFPGQGLAPVGVLDAFWDSKGYITPEQYRRFCNATVPLARMRSRLFTNDKPFEATIEVAHFGPNDLENAAATWRVRSEDGRELARGRLDRKTIKTGVNTSLGTITVPLNGITRASKLNFQVAFDGTDFANDWDFWVYPVGDAATSSPAGVTVVEDLDGNAIATLARGGKVLLLLDPKKVSGDTLGSFEPIFWNRVTFPTQKQHTLGVLCDPKHPALASFPTENHSDWQWWDIQQSCTPLVLDAFPRELRPIIQMIDDWNVCRKLALAFEVNVGKTSLLVCSVDLKNDLEHRLAARQLRRSLIDYVASDQFAPTVSVSPEQLKSLIAHGRKADQ
jgi:hypothetical protein